MYTHVRPRKHKSKAVANNVVQKQDGPQGFGGMDAGCIGFTRFTSKGDKVHPEKDQPVQLQTFRRNSDGTTGELVAQAGKNLITVTGWIKRGQAEQQEITGSLDYHIDAQDEKRVVIGTIKCTPKRTGAGSVLIYLLAGKAVDAGMKLMGTDLSALEEGTPEFYMSIGLTPTMERAQQVQEIVEQDPEISGEQIKNLMYSARLDAEPKKVMRLAAQKLGTWIPD